MKNWFIAMVAGVGVLLSTLALAANPPNPTPVLTVKTGTSIQLSWTSATTYTDGTAIPASVLSNEGNKLYSMNNFPTTGITGFIGYMSNPTVRQMTTPGTFCYAVTNVVYNPNAHESARGPTICILVSSTISTTPAPPAPLCVLPVVKAVAVPTVPSAPTQ